MPKKRVVISSVLILVVLWFAAVARGEGTRAADPRAKTQTVALSAAASVSVLPQQGPTDLAELEAFLDELMAKDLDPPEFATEELLPYLTNGEQVILRDFGHTETFGNSQSEARTHLLTSFFDTGQVDASLYTYQPVNFDVGLGWPNLAKVVLDAVLAVIVLLLALVAFAVGRVRQRRTT